MTAAAPAAARAPKQQAGVDPKGLSRFFLPARVPDDSSAARYRSGIAEPSAQGADSAWRLEWARKGALAKLSRPIGYREVAELYYRLPLDERLTLQPGIRHIRQRAGLRGENDGRTVIGLGANLRFGR